MSEVDSFSDYVPEYEIYLVSRLLEEIHGMYELADLDRLIDESSKNSRLRKAAMLTGVRDSEDFKRILALPRRVFDPAEAETLADELTAALKTSTGTMRLKPTQAQALLELGTLGRLVGQIRAGGGKTLLSFLAGSVLFAKRPLLLVPAKLVGKTKRELSEYAKHFRVTTHLYVLSYESLSRVSHASFLEEFAPDLIIADEAHKLKNTRAAVTRRVKRYVEPAVSEGRCRFVPMSGTFTTRSIHDYAHLFRWALGNGSPTPLGFTALEEWSLALDEKPRGVRLPPGVLSGFCDGSEDLEKVRKGYGRRVVETPAVVATFDKLADVSLTISRIEKEAPPEVVAAFDRLRDEGETPDGWLLFEGLEIAAAGADLGLGYFRRWNPRGPEPWMLARRMWGMFLRSILKRSRRLDSELQVALACSRGELVVAEETFCKDNELKETPYKTWYEIRGTFKPKSEIVWVSDFALRAAEEWLSQNQRGALLWCDDVLFSQELSRRTGIPYCGREGLDATGKYIEDFEGEPLVTSFQSNLEGRNLQKHYYRNLLISPSSSGARTEQFLARTHRDGQPEDEVTCDVFSFCAEHENAFMQALNDAVHIEDTGHQPQRLLYSDLLWPTLVSRRPYLSVIDSSSVVWNKE